MVRMLRGLKRQLGDVSMTTVPDWQPVCDYWFPAGLDAGAAKHRAMIMWWFGGGANAGLKPFAPLVAAALARRLDAWRIGAKSRLALILLLDQFTRGLFAGTPAAYAGDALALEIAEEGIGNGHYDLLAHPWEKTFFFMPLGHAEGPDHPERLRRVVAMAKRIAREAPTALRPLYEHGTRQARANLELIRRFGRFPHRNAVLGRASSADEATYVAKGEFIHHRAPPPYSRQCPFQSVRTARR
jgi:uncharacterized protein (DUF924 family)